MKPEDLIRAGNVLLVFDMPNIPLRTLFSLVKDAAAVRIPCAIPLTAYIEKATQIRRTMGASYDAMAIKDALQDAGVAFLPLDVAAASEIIERLCAWYPRGRDWQAAKWERLFGKKDRSHSQTVPATIDWYMAALCGDRAIMVTNDQGLEYRKCPRIGVSRLQKLLHES